MPVIVEHLPDRDFDMASNADLVLTLASFVMGVVVDRMVKGEAPMLSPAPIHVEAAVAQSKWEDERYKKLEHQLERQEDRLNLQSDLIADLTERINGVDAGTSRPPLCDPKKPFGGFGCVTKRDP